MKVTLEKEELIRILSSEFGYDINENDVTVSAEPFEVQIKNLPVDTLAKKAKKEAELAEVLKAVTAAGETTEVETPVVPEEEVSEVLTMEDLLAQNETLMSGGKPQNKPVSSDFLERPLGPNEFEDPPPVTEAELGTGLAALTRIANGEQQ